MSGCPKHVLNGPCGGMKPDGVCELGDRRCVFAEKHPSRIVLDPGFTFRPEIHGRRGFTKLLTEVERRPVWIAEVPPSLGILENINMLKGLSFTALSIPDNPLATLHVEPAALGHLLKDRLGCEVIVHLTCRDLNRLAIKSRLLALGLYGIEHVLALTGDHPKLGPEKDVKPVFELDSVRLIYLARIMTDYGVDDLGRKIGGELRLQVGAGLNPYLPVEVEVSRVLRKLEAGAEFFISQLVFGAEPAEDLLKALRSSGVSAPIFIGFLMAEASLAKKVLRMIGLPETGLSEDLEKLAEGYVEVLGKLRRTYGPVGAFISTLGRLENLGVWDRVFRASFGEA